MTDLLAESTLATLLALAATFLGLAAAVQILQELWKHLSRSQAKAYHQVLVDFAGPWIEQLLVPGVVNDLEARGPFQILKVRPKGVLLPMSKDELIRAIERVAPVWVRRTLEQIQVERELQKAVAVTSETVWSPGWKKLQRELEELSPHDPTFWDAERVRAFLATWDETMPTANAAALLVGFRRRFLPDALRIEEFFPQLERNLEYSYQRRNLRQSFIFGLLLALLFFLPFNELLQRASQPSLAESLVFAKERLAAYDDVSQRIPTSKLPARKELESQLAKLLNTPGSSAEMPTLERTLEKYRGIRTFPALAAFLFNCLITAVLVSFGAPFWHNLTSALWQAGRSRSGSNEKEAQA